MNKGELIDSLAGSTGTTKAEASRCLEALTTTVTEELQNGGVVVIPGFGTFSIGNRAARVGRNPRTGTQIDIPASRVAKFKAGKALKDAVQVAELSES